MHVCVCVCVCVANAYMNEIHGVCVLVHVERQRCMHAIMYASMLMCVCVCVCECEEMHTSVDLWKCLALLSTVNNLLLL